MTDRRGIRPGARAPHRSPNGRFGWSTLSHAEKGPGLFALGAEVSLRYIFTASLCTLAIIAGLLALPPMGEAHSQLVRPPTGERVFTTGPDESPDVGRHLASPEPRSSSEVVELALVDLGMIPEAEPEVEVLGTQELASAATSSSSTSTTSDAPPSAEPDSTSSTTTTTTTTTTSTISPTTTTATTTTTEAPEPIVPLDDEAPDSGGVLISPRGVVMPVVGRSSNGWRAMTPCGNEVTTDQGNRVVTVDFVLDPGHGGSETGATAPDGTYESALNLRIAEIVAWYLDRAGYTTLLTRTTDIRMPLRSRAEIAQTLQPKAFVSIHHNGGATRPQSTPGTEMFVDGGNDEARRLGGILFEELTTRLSAFDADWVGTVHNGVSTRLNNDGADLYGIHRFTPGLPSVITEAGYLSNASEAALFTDNDVQWAHGRAIADGLVRWASTSDPGSGYLPNFVDASSSGTGGFDGCVDPRL